MVWDTPVNRKHIPGHMRTAQRCSDGHGLDSVPAWRETRCVLVPEVDKEDEIDQEVFVSTDQVSQTHREVCMGAKPSQFLPVTLTCLQSQPHES